MGKRTKPSRVNLPDRRTLVNSVRTLFKAVESVVQRVDQLTRSQLELSIVMRALKTKGILTDEDVQVEWKKFKADLDKDQKDSQEGDVEPEGEDADLSSPESARPGILHFPGNRDADGSEGEPAEGEPADQRDPTTSSSAE